MRKFKFWLLSVAIPLFLVGCVTVQDIQTANRLIHADDQLQTLVQARDQDETGGAKAQLVALGQDAMKQAGLMEANEATRREAISYYRIAATAFWQSRSESVVSEMFSAADKGNALCKSMGDNAPDRDRLFLTLVIPFAAVEASLGDVDATLGQVKRDLDAGNVTPETVDALKRAYGQMQTARSAIGKIDALEQDPALAGHAEFLEYYASNQEAAHKSFEAQRKKLGPLVQELQSRNANATGSDGEALGLTVDDVQDLKL